MKEYSLSQDISKSKSTFINDLESTKHNEYQKTIKYEYNHINNVTIFTSAKNSLKLMNNDKLSYPKDIEIYEDDDQFDQI